MQRSVQKTFHFAVMQEGFQCYPNLQQQIDRQTHIDMQAHRHIKIDRHVHMRAKEKVCLGDISLLNPLIQCSQFWLSILFLKVQGTSMSFKFLFGAFEDTGGS